MPKIRDLGINTIPITMRPPEIGPGGGLYACDDHSHADQTSACGEASCGGDEDEDETSGCSEASCVGEEQSVCPDASCKPKPPSPPGHHHSAFNPDAIAQLRQQLEIHIGT
jgi:hypothetical protein